MRGAEEFAILFETGQYGRLYLVSGNTARGAGFRVFVLPAGERALPNMPCSAPLNRDAVEMHEIDAKPSAPVRTGWRGSMHPGNWQQDFAAPVEARCAAAPVEARCAAAADARLGQGLPG